MSDTPRAQLIHIDVDRRLGHEWDEWDGRPLPNGGDFDSAPSLFFGWAALALVTAADKLCAYMKCLEEVTAGNREFVEAEKMLELLRGVN